MFTFAALLVQEGFFRMVEMYFLIVGHTHASIDQYFSVLSRDIAKTNFIGSPLALEALFSRERMSNLSGDAWSRADNEHKLKSKPLLVRFVNITHMNSFGYAIIPLLIFITFMHRKLCVFYDMKAALNPLVNKNIRYYPIPHHFRFEMYNGVAAMQYRIFSTHKDLLPYRPETIPGAPPKYIIYTLYICIWQWC